MLTATKLTPIPLADEEIIALTQVPTTHIPAVRTLTAGDPMAPSKRGLRSYSGLGGRARVEAALADCAAKPAYLEVSRWTVLLSGARHVADDVFMLETSRGEVTLSVSAEFPESAVRPVFA